VHRRDHLIQGQVRLFGNQCELPFCLLLQRRHAPTARLGRTVSAVAKALHPFDHCTGADLELFGRLRSQPVRRLSRGYPQNMPSAPFGPSGIEQCRQSHPPTHRFLGIPDSIGPEHALTTSARSRRGWPSSELGRPQNRGQLERQCCHREQCYSGNQNHQLASTQILGQRQHRRSPLDCSGSTKVWRQSGKIMTVKWRSS
jgi:hypothetical protein